ncbi:hypothetical protein C8R44DRAFT_745413 [Mycena epipterygia]|nr:hypothetical protein C8R44DRAFT_745413 [Mycena epipterygia]
MPPHWPHSGTVPVGGGVGVDVGVVKVVVAVGPVVVVPLPVLVGPDGGGTAPPGMILNHFKSSLPWIGTHLCRRSGIVPEDTALLLDLLVKVRRKERRVGGAVVPLDRRVRAGVTHLALRAGRVPRIDAAGARDETPSGDAGVDRSLGMRTKTRTTGGTAREEDARGVGAVGGDGVCNHIRDSITIATTVVRVREPRVRRGREVRRAARGALVDRHDDGGFRGDGRGLVDVHPDVGRIGPEVGDLLERRGEASEKAESEKEENGCEQRPCETKHWRYHVALEMLIGRSEHLLGVRLHPGEKLELRVIRLDSVKDRGL